MTGWRVFIVGVLSFLAGGAMTDFAVASTRQAKRDTERLRALLPAPTEGDTSRGLEPTRGTPWPFLHRRSTTKDRGHQR
jgi:hypothetical protein